MKDEIKEILKLDEQLLDKIENILASELNNEEYDTFYNYFNEIRKPNILVDIKDVDSVKNYITNLQDKIKQYEDPEDLTLFYMWLDVKAKDKMKQLQEEKEKYKHKFWEEQEQNEYLQDRMKELETINEEHRKLNGELREENKRLKTDYGTKAQVERDLLKEENKKLENDKRVMLKKLYEANDKVDKAIEYIKLGLANEEEAEELLEILQGSDE